MKTLHAFKKTCLIKINKKLIKDVWNLFRETNFIYDRKEAYLSKIFPKILKTWEKLYLDRNELNYTICYKLDEDLLGTASAVNVYDKTWILQHLVIKTHPINQIVKDIMLGISSFLIKNVEIDFVITYFQPNKKFPKRLYSEFKAKYPFEDELHFRKYSFLSYEISEANIYTYIDIILRELSCSQYTIKEANKQDLEEICCFFNTIYDPLEIISKNLNIDLINLSKISSKYIEYQLVRERKIYVIKNTNDKLLAFSLLENTSQGINLSGLLNTFSIYLIKPISDNKSEIYKFLIAFIIKIYSNWDYKTAICLAIDDDLIDYINFGFKNEREYICFTAARNSFAFFYNFLEEKYTRLGN